MREYFRWENNYGFDYAIPQEEIGRWLSLREKLWDDIEQQDYLPLPINGRDYAPFDTKEINQVLLPQGYIYSGGIGLRATPHFFIAKLAAEEYREDHHILISDTEYARDLTAPPAMSIDNTIFIRRESLKRMLWEKLGEWRWHRSPGMMDKALRFYDFDHDPETALKEMCDIEENTMILHEIGEIQSAKMLSDEWRMMLAALNDAQAELIARAVKDHLADMLSTLPHLLAKQSMPSLYLYFAMQSPLRKQIFPSLLEAAQQWNDGRDWNVFQTLITEAIQHWSDTAREMLKIFNQKGPRAATDIIQFADSKIL